MKLKSLVFLILLCVIYPAFGQSVYLDSLRNAWNEAENHDTLRLNALLALAMKGYVYSKPDSALTLLRTHYEFAEENGLHLHASRGLLAQGTAYYVKGDLDSSAMCMEQALILAEKIHDILLEARANNNLGTINKERGKLAIALEYYDKAVKLKKEAGDDVGAAGTKSNIAVILMEQGNFEEALEMFESALEVLEGSENLIGLGNTYTNIAYIHDNFDEDSLTIVYTRKALNIWKNMNNLRGISNAYNNLGASYEKSEDFDSAVFYYNESIQLKIAVGDSMTLPSSYSNVGNIYYKKGDLGNALKYNKIAWEINNKYPKLKNEMEIAKRLYKIYKDKHDFKRSLKMYERYIVARDSLNSIDAQESSLKMQLNYEFEKRQDSLAIEHEKAAEIAAIEQREKDELAAAESLRKNIIIGFTIVVLIALFIFSVIIRNRLKVTREQKQIIEDQKKVVEAHQEEIIDSISYAKRIQTAILPTDQMVSEIFTDSFVLYMPKDIVAGDFYWMDMVDGRKYFAAADCTGHGVPGAMVSVICNNALNRSLREYGLKNPADILNKSRELVIQEFAKADQDVKDGMDIALCAIEQNKVYFSGAHNPLWIIRNGELIEIKADKQPIGNFEFAQPFTNNEFDLQKGDTLYVFSDGYADQFGGEKGKKFKSKSMKELLLSLQSKSMSEQKELIKNSFTDWKGDFDQIDDICVIGVRV